MNPIRLIHHKALSLISVITLSIVPLGAEVVFGPVVAGAGKSVRLVSHTTSEEGTVKLEKDGKVTNGTIVFSRDRDLAWTFREPAEDGSQRGMVTIAKIATKTTVKLKGKPEEVVDESPLNGKMLAMSKSVAGDWKFELDGSVPMRRIENEVAELTLYLKRKWYPQRRVKLGESWEFDPAWIRMLIEKDLKGAQMIGTMRLRQIRKTATGETAVIDVSIRGTGGDFTAEGDDSSAKIELSGQAVVNLKTMLDESLTLKGTLVTSAGNPGERKTVTLPLQLEVTKTLVDN